MDKDDSDHEMEDDEQGEEEEDMEATVWRGLLKRVYEEMDFSSEDGTAAEILGSKAMVKKISSRLRDEVVEMVKFGVYLNDVSPLYQKLISTTNKLMNEEDYEDEEATVKAWKDRQFVVHQMIQEHSDILKDIIDKDEETDKPFEYIPTVGDPIV